jgi:hypothetical protein
MTLAELQSKRLRELDALIAEKVYGREGIALYPAWHNPEGPGYLYDDYSKTPEAGMQPGVYSEFTSPSGRLHKRVDFVPLYSTDLNLIHEAEAKVIEKVGWFEWTNVLVKVLGLGIHHEFVHEDVFGVSRATAKERAIACLLALEEA